MKLVIGNRNYSSWSLRAWLFLRANDLEFEEIKLSLFDDDWSVLIARYNDAQRVPVLIDRGVRVWDSLAIVEYVNECYDTPVGWPRRRERLGHARSIVAEMHSGFLAVRAELPQNIRARHPLSRQTLSEDCRLQVTRIEDIWTDCRKRYADDGPWLFGRMTIADIFYAPVAMRFITYGISLSDAAAQYVETVTGCSHIQEWSAAATTEPESLSFIDDLSPLERTPLKPG